MKQIDDREPFVNVRSTLLSGFLRTFSLSASVLVLVLATGCGTLPVFVHVAVWHPVWLSDGWVYHLREFDSDGRELWRQRDGDAERVRATVPGSCSDGEVDFLFPLTAVRLGVGVECGPSTCRLPCDASTDDLYTEIFSYDPKVQAFVKERRFEGYVSGAAVRPDFRSGFLELSTYCGSAVVLFDRTEKSRMLVPTRTDGTTWTLANVPPASCETVAHSSSATLSPDGRRFLLASAPETLGTLPLGPDSVDQLRTVLYMWEGNFPEAEPRRIAVLPGRGPNDVAMSPDDSIAVASSGASDAGVFLLDVTTGKVRHLVDGTTAYHPTFSPDGKRLAYVDSLEEIKIVDLP